jgi:carbon-monoxide dehydrogenase medium subunit
MKPPEFLYARPASLDEAVETLRSPGARALAGGQSLVPMMNFRLARPRVLVDLAAVPDLAEITRDGELLRVGSMTRQCDLEYSELAFAASPLLRAALAHVGHPQIRSRGTVGGSIAHADPAAELPAVALALDAELVAEGPAGRRSIRATDFFLGPYATALAADEVLVEISLRACAQTAFTEFSRRSGDFALAGVIVAIEKDEPRIAVFGVSFKPARLPGVESLLRGQQLTVELAAEAGAAAAKEIAPIASHGASERYRRQLTAVLTRRALAEVMHETDQHSH